MNMNLIEEAINAAKKVRKEGTNQKQKEVYSLVEKRLNMVLQSMQDQQFLFRQMSNMAFEEINNPVLVEQFQMIERSIFRELEAVEELGRTIRSIANE